MKHRNLFLEAIIIGISTIIVGFLSTRILTNNTYPPLNDPNLGLMIFNYFIIGFALHIIFEYLGLNKWYCNSFF